MAEKRLVVIDGKSVFYRGYYGVPNLSLPDGTPTGGVYGFAVLALQIIKKLEPDYVIVAWDKAKTNVRSRLKIYPEYKAGRKPMPDDMREQIPYLHDLLEAFGWPLLEVDDYEADDIMGTLAIMAQKQGIETALVTSDLDLLQMVDGNIKLFALKKGLTNIKQYDDATIEEEFGFSKEKFDDYKALKGDSSDNIPGVAGIGEKTAKELVLKYETLENIYENLWEFKETLRKKLEAGKEMAFMSRELVHIMTDAPVKLDLKAADIHNVNPAAVTEKLRQFQFKSLLAQVPESWKQTAETVVKKEPRSLQNMVIKHVKELPKLPSELVVHYSVDNLYLSPDDETAYEITWEVGLDYLKKNKPFIIGYDLKAFFLMLIDHKVDLLPISHDVKMGAFLINALLRDTSLTALTGNDINQDEPVQVLSAIWSLYDEQSDDLKSLPKVTEVARNIEWPVIPVLARMEHRGIKLNASYLKKMSLTLKNQISDIEQEIYGYADHEFNISSPSQLAEVLFNELNLPTQFIKKTKTGYSTAHAELMKLQDLHPIIPLIIQYREWTKLKSTYVDTLPLQIADDGRVHTTFDLDVAASGRLSSRDPNLQNIPIRTDLGKTIRNAFIPDKGNVFVSADYSQFELRLCAAFSGDEDMIKAFNEDQDIHTETAALVQGIEIADVTPAQRSAAKAVNFGIMYGQGPHGLSQVTGMTIQDSKAFIDKYFEIRKSLREYIDSLIEKAKNDGYVETLFGRRRPTPDIKSSNFVVREAAKRAAMNHPMQGTEADLMKMAMIKLEQEFDLIRKKKKDKRKEIETPSQLLQIHDSILVECEESEAEDVAKLMKEVMESIYPKLPIKLTVDTKIGKTWGEL